MVRRLVLMIASVRAKCKKDVWRQETEIRSTNHRYALPERISLSMLAPWDSILYWLHTVPDAWDGIMGAPGVEA
jgi:hypothetical protein